MRLVKINDIILNMDKIAVIRGRIGSSEYGGGIAVYAYVNSSNYVELGRCETEEDYEEFMSALYKELEDSFVHEAIPMDEEPELWEK